ncbi:MAG: succinylglutamate desuccinylase/aspartoacylase family protein, partial [Myxococcota bacterium]
HDFYLRLVENAMGEEICIPVSLLRGIHDGPTLGMTASVHGDELNGIRIIHHVLDSIEPEQLRGSLLCLPILNVPSFQLRQREYPDGTDLNHVFPGKKDGTPAQQYAYRVVRAFLDQCDLLIDIHTASEGRVNTFYVRADLHAHSARQMAERMEPEIILHGRSGDGTLRTAARKRGIPAVTLEAGNPGVFQGRMVYEGEQGIRNILIAEGMIQGQLEISKQSVICKDSKWLRTQTGGLLDVVCTLGQHVEKKQLLARTIDAFGQDLREYRAPYAGIVIGKAAYPIAVAGTRFCHLGRIGDPVETETPSIS